ncbi:ATP-binding protein [Variovorax sp. W6]|uniref:ATP-binding protein n=1 Tax=Variovorax sp. W6 TaxID=3093895 RepID=UPI003D80979F
MTAVLDESPINAEPTKTFFVEMLTRDIALEQALLDLIDNSVDGAKSLGRTGDTPFLGLQIRIEFDKTKFRIIDNCGGFDRATARDYAFRFGRPANSPRTPHSIGQFGVGMKRALFKFGHHFSIRSATKNEAWAVDVAVQEWENQKDWHFPWSPFVPDDQISQDTPGVEIIASELRGEVGWKFSSPQFQNAIIGLIKSKHRQFIAQGLQIIVNGISVDAFSLYLLVREDGRFRPGLDNFQITDTGESPVNVRIIVGVGQSAPKEAGWNVICNGRVILEADRREVTGWGVVEDESNSIAIPTFHNQFARFRGIVNFDSDDSSRVPWNTTKTDVNQDSPVWQTAFGRMVEMMRPVISFLNDLDNDIEEFTKNESPLLDFVSKSVPMKVETLNTKAAFLAPARGSISKTVRTIKVQYSKPVDDVEFLMAELKVSSAKAVGEKTFELAFERMGGK